MVREQVSAWSFLTVQKNKLISVQSLIKIITFSYKHVYFLPLFVNSRPYVYHSFTICICSVL